VCSQCVEEIENAWIVSFCEIKNKRGVEKVRVGRGEDIVRVREGLKGSGGTANSSAREAVIDL